MKKHILALAILGVCANVNFASAESCRNYAEAAADDWAGGRILPIGDDETAASGQLLVIAYGKKYIVPRKTPNDGSVIRHGLGRLAAMRNEVFEEELERCLHPKKVTVTVHYN